MLDEFQAIVLSIVSKVVIPILPFFIATTFCGLAYEGTITKQLPVFIQVILIVMVGHYLWMALLYILAGIYSGKNPLEVVKHYGPAYITAVGTMSSAATLAVALRCAGPVSYTHLAVYQRQGNKHGFARRRRITGRFLGRRKDDEGEKTKA